MRIFGTIIHVIAVDRLDDTFAFEAEFGRAVVLVVTDDRRVEAKVGDEDVHLVADGPSVTDLCRSLELREIIEEHLGRIDQKLPTQVASIRLLSPFAVMYVSGNKLFHRIPFEVQCGPVWESS